MANGGVTGAMVTQVGTTKNDDFLQWSSVERHYVQLLREATRPSATENPRPSNKNPGADEDFPLLYILYERLRD
jgi:hypothetical protein